MSELDYLLLEQYHSAKRNYKRLKALRRIMPHEPLIVMGLEYNENKLQFIESMIHDKSILRKKAGKRKKEHQVQGRDDWYGLYREIIASTLWTYRFAALAARAWSAPLVPFLYRKKGDPSRQSDSGADV